jgi:hypothetical protein
MILRTSASVIVILLGSLCVAESPPACKPVKHYGVSGCELRPDGTCPPGYHKEAVGPPDPRMKAPAYLMCVVDKPKPPEQPPDMPPKSNR